MGAGLERFAWITMGTPTAYDCCFGPITGNLFSKAGIDIDSELLAKYFTEIAKSHGTSSDIFQVRKNAISKVGLTDDQVNRIINPMEGLYLIADHLRTLIFSISDGALPSNVGGGYNLRIILRRIVGTMNRLGLKLDLNELIDMHIDYLKETYPELDEKRADVKTIIGIESKRYEESKVRMEKIVNNLRAKGTPTVDELITLYESDGITPDYLKELNAISEIPSTFYSKLSELHQSESKKTVESLPLEGLPETELLFYGDDPKEFDAKVLKAFEKYVVLDKTSFYARGGGQEPDHGTIAGFQVVDVNKHGGVVVHELSGGIPKERETVPCVVDSKRRTGITKHHTSTHILNSSSRSVLGSWVWQHSAFKEVDHARLDITHHSALTPEEIEKIEQLANAKVKENLPVTIQNFDRGTAEQKYGFRIYQGGVVPVKSVRIVSIGDFDIEACGGTHVKKTGEVDLIKIQRAKRIQDGVVRLEFVAGESAYEYEKQYEADLQEKTAEAAAKEERDKIRDQKKIEARKKIEDLIIRVSNPKEPIEEFGIEKATGTFYITADEQYGEYFHINFGEKLIKNDPNASYCGIFEEGDKVRVIAYTGEASKNNAGEIAKEVSGILGGAGGGNARFGQGGGKNKSKKAEAVTKAKSMVED